MRLKKRRLKWREGRVKVMLPAPITMSLFPVPASGCDACSIDFHILSSKPGVDGERER